MICRVWRAQATAQNAPLYQDVALNKVIPSIEARGIPGFRKIDLLRRTLANGDVQFSSFMWFDNPQDIVAFTGEDSEAAYLPKDITDVLSQYDQRAMHFELIAERIRP